MEGGCMLIALRQNDNMIHVKPRKGTDGEIVKWLKSYSCMNESSDVIFRMVLI